MEAKNRKRKWLNTVKFFAAYLVAAWTFLQFVDWILIRYSISPYWVDILLWFFIGISPSLLIYLYHQERLSKRIIKLREKIFIPLNIVILVIGLYLGFGNSDLGATTQAIEYTDDEGNIQSKTITKEEFRIGVPLFTFENLKDNDSIDWWRNGISKLLAYDLEQNKSISPYYENISQTSDKIRQASLFHSFYIDGNFEKEGEQISITVYKRKANNAKVLKQQTFTGTDFLAMIDEISFYITEQAGFVETNTIQYIDLPVKEFMSYSEKAVQKFIERDFDGAISLDSTFAMAYLEKAKQLYRWNNGQLEVQDVTDKAYAFRSKLPLQKQLEVNIQRNLAFKDFDLAEQQVKLQLEVDPTNEFYNDVLFGIYGETRNIDGYYKQSEALFDKDLNPANGENLINAAILSGRDKFIIDQLKSYEIINSNIKAFKIQPLIQLGAFDQAESLINEIKSLQNPQDNRINVFDSAVAYLKTNGFDSQLLEQFEGHYRSFNNEQTIEMWIENDRIIRYLGHQEMTAYSLGGPTTLVGGSAINASSSIDLIKDIKGKAIAIKTTYYTYNSSPTFLFFKEDENIRKAHEAFKNNNTEAAKRLYEIAYAENPKHGYLKNILNHINFIQNTDPEELKSQHIKHSGDYGQRKFYIEGGTFYYKRKGENSDLPRVQLLALDENRYMDLTRLGTIMTFVNDSSGKMASKSYSYIMDDDSNFKWEHVHNDEVINYFVKDN
ncbi:hypothetical protein [Winogradskyella aurantia]|uniref:Uncharacterized protein n=1 Tax=Winogradskyella aurantia TaxID=1915063 RepID=A0A265UXA4_9FLAO|nr:hypothetical protein [Winogradskyella aurantia]OZV69948.1 hypothetical protein CA834_04840 [Winogradskyella aurantia]